jgi:hypothetical protein
LVLVVECQAEAISEGHEGALGGIGLGFLKGALVCFAQRVPGAVADAAALPGHEISTGADADAHARGIHTCLRFALDLVPNALRRYRLSVPPVKAKDAIGLSDRVPPFDIGEQFALMLPGFHEFLVQLAREQLDLVFPEHHRVLTAIVTPPLPKAAPGTDWPALSAAKRKPRSGFGPCGLQ